MSMMWNFEGVPPITFLPSGGNGTSSSTSIPSKASPNRDADLAAALIIFLVPTPYLLVGPRMPLSNPTCASTVTKADPALAPNALTITGVTSWDAQQLTLGKITLNSPATERTDLNRLQAMVIPPEDTPNYLSQLTPPTPIDINKFASYLQGYPDHTTVNHLLTGFPQGFKIGYSVTSTMTCGIPQGSSLGPVLFLIYINYLPNCSNALTFRIFADDTNVFASARNLKDLEEIVNSELKKVKIWCDVNRLSINFTKTNFMIIKSSKKKDDQVSIKIESADGTINVLQRKQKIKYLGVLLDETMSFNHHISYICTRIARNNGIISKLRHYLTLLQMKQIYYT